MDEKPLSIEEEKLRNLIELATDGILIGSHEGVVIDANATFCSMMEMRKEEIIGSFIGDMPFTKESLERYPFRFDLLHDGQLVISERDLIQSDGNKITIEMRTKMMPDGTYQSIYRDISERKRYELQLLDYANELSKLNADKDQFISILAHDLVSPFNTIIGYLDLLTIDFDNSDIKYIKDQLAVVHSVSIKTFNLLQEILTWFRSYSGNMTYEPGFYNLKDISQNTLDILGPIARNKRIEITNSIDNGVTVYTDSNMLCTIIRNLLSNAIKFTDEEGEIIFSTSEKDGKIILSVKDTGKGIPNDKIKTLFKGMHNKSTEGTSSEKGTGLGLAICKMLAEKQGGTIGVESELGKGSTFYVSIPMHKD